ncbi:polysaccharide deacetylase family protein [Lusitaniella coriacea]|uniref:polysaccharide deacetylase family protein n=1 Tax=Lusitaniella coriacea TaxID=1983105 RepID=UPI003CFBBBFD
MQFAPLYPLLYRLLKPAFPGCLWTGSRDRPRIALTFDDGPHPTYTPQLLKILDFYQISASFFLLGTCVEKYPDLAKDVARRGHWIGLHGYYHHSFPLLSPPELRDSLQKNQRAIASACQIDPHNLRDVRPPNGLFVPQTLQHIHQWNYRPVMWSVVPEDWVRPGISTVVGRVLSQVKNGSLIVLHDGKCGGQDVAQTAEMLIPQLLERGYQFTTIDEFQRDRSEEKNVPDLSV